MQDDSAYKAQGCLGYYLLFWYWGMLLVGLLYLGVSLGLLTGLLKAVPESLVMPGPGGNPVPTWFYYVELPVIVVLWLGSAATYTLRRWGVPVFALGMGLQYGLQLYIGDTWLDALGLWIWPALLVILSWKLLFPGRTAEMPQVRQLR